MCVLQQPPPAPTITLEHLVLRPFSQHDAANLHVLLSDPDVRAAFGHDAAPALEEVEAHLPAMIAGYTSHGNQMCHLNIAIADRETGALTGLIGLDLVGDAGDVRIAMSPAARRHGHGKGALGALLEWARASTGINTVIGVTKLDNAAAAAIMAATGMVETHEDAGNEDGGMVPARTFAWKRPGQEPAGQRPEAALED